MGNQPGGTLSHSNPADRNNITRINQNLRRDISATGNMVQMKILIRGAPKSGKTALWNRLCGKPFPTAHIPTNQIQNGIVHWKYEDTPVLISVWDVVDRESSTDSILKLSHKPKVKKNQRGSFSLGLADSSTVQVYKDACAVLFLINPFSPSSIKYVNKMILETPPDVDILILRNFCDMDTAKTKALVATESDTKNKKKNIPIDKTFFSLKVKYAEKLDEKYKDMKKYTSATNRIFQYEVSVKNGFGLQAIHSWLKLPYLRFAQKSLEKQLAENKKTQKSLCKILGPSQKVDSLFIKYQDYPNFIQFLNQRAKSLPESTTRPNQVQNAAHPNTNPQNGSKSSSKQLSKPKPSIDPSFFDQEDDLNSFLGIEDQEIVIKTQVKKMTSIDPTPEQIPERLPTPDEQYFDDSIDSSWAESETTPVVTPVVPTKKSKKKKSSIFQEPEPEPTFEHTPAISTPNLLQIAASSNTNQTESFDEESEDNTTTDNENTDQDFSPMPSPLPSPAISRKKAAHTKTKPKPQAIEQPPQHSQILAPAPQKHSKHQNTLLMASKIAASNPNNNEDSSDSNSDSSDEEPEFDFNNSSGDDDNKSKSKSTKAKGVFTFSRNPLLLEEPNDLLPKSKSKKGKKSKKSKKSKGTKAKSNENDLTFLPDQNNVTEDLNDWLS